MWETFSKNHCLVVNSLGGLSLFGVVPRANVCRVDMVNIIPTIVSKKARFFEAGSMVIGGLVIMKFDMSHPDRIVPKASRFRAPVSFGFSSLAGTRGKNVGVLEKQKWMIRKEYAAVRRVARSDSRILRKLESLESPSSRIRSLE